MREPVGAAPRPPSPGCVPAGWGGGGTLGRFLGFGTGLGRGKVPVASAWAPGGPGLCFPGGGVPGGVGVRGGLWAGGWGGGWLGACSGAWLPDARRGAGGCVGPGAGPGCRADKEGLPGAGRGDGPAAFCAAPGELWPPGWPGGGCPGFGGAGAGFFTAAERGGHAHVPSPT